MPTIADAFRGQVLAGVSSLSAKHDSSQSHYDTSRGTSESYPPDPKYISFEHDASDRGNANVAREGHLSHNLNAVVTNHAIDSSSDVFSLADFTAKERAKQPVPRKVPTRFWDPEVLPSPEEVDIGQELSDRSPVWERYRMEAKEHDKILSEGWTGDMDVLLVFAALFSGILTAFIIEFYKQLQPQPDSTNTLLSLSSKMEVLLGCIANHTACTNVPIVPDTSTTPRVPTAYRWINALWFTSLTISLLVSAVAILVKQWVHAYHSGLNGNPTLYGRLRQYRHNGIKNWRMSGVIRALPSLMYLAVILFFVGLLVLLSNLDHTIYYICLSICVTAGFAYALTLVSPIVDPSCPFRTPASRFLDDIYQLLSFYGHKLSLICIRQLVLAIISIWHFVMAIFSNFKIQRFGTRLFNTLNHIESQLIRHLTFTPISEREMEAIATQTSSLDADALAWLSSTNEVATQEIVMQAISGLSFNDTLPKFCKTFKLRRSPSSFLVDAYHNPNSDISHHHRLANYAQAYLMILSNCPEVFSMADAKAIELIRDALQWYPSLTALGIVGDPPRLSREMLSQAIKELSEGLSIITNLSVEDVQEWEICSQIITDLILQSILLVYILFNENSIQSQIVDSSFETLQIWIGLQTALDAHTRPVYLLSLCSLVQLFSGITSSSHLSQCWFSKDRHKDTWTLLLKSLVSLLEAEQRQDFSSLFPEEFLTNGLVHETRSRPQFRHWRLLQCALQDCHALLSNDRATFDLVLELFLKTDLASIDLLRNKSLFRCLHLIGPFFTPEDTVKVLSFFKVSLQNYASTNLCQFLQARCQELAHAEALVTSETFNGMIEDLLFTADFHALWLFATILQTLSQKDSLVLNGPISCRMLSSIHLALTEKIQRGHPQSSWDYYAHWCLPFSLAASCRRLHRTYNISTAQTGIIEVLHQLSVILAVSELRERKEARNFINTLLKLQEWERLH